MPGAAFSLCSPPAPAARRWGCSSTYLVPGSCPAPRVPCRAGCCRAGTRPSCPPHATHLILCSPFLAVKQETVQLRPSPGSCVCSRLISGAPVSSLALGRGSSYLLGHPPLPLCDSEAEPWLVELLVALGDGVSPRGFGAEKSSLGEVQ